MNSWNQYSYSVSRLLQVSYLGIYWQVLWHKTLCILTTALIMLQFPDTVMGHRKIQLLAFINETWAKAWSCFHEYSKTQLERNELFPLSVLMLKHFGCVALWGFFVKEVDLIFKYVYCLVIKIQLQHQDMRAINLMRRVLVLLLSLSSSAKHQY